MLRSALVALLIAQVGDPGIRSSPADQGGTLVLYAPFDVQGAFASGFTLPTGQVVTVVRGGTATYINNGIVTSAATNTARVEAGGLLVEPARTNVALQSETTCVANAVQAPWTLTGTPTCVTNAATSPANTATADSWTSTANTDLVSQTTTVASSTAYAVSQWFHHSSSGTVTLRATCLGGSTALNCTCDTSDKRHCASTIASPNCTATSVADTVWHRLVVGLRCNAAQTSVGMAFAPGELGVSTGTAEVWGAQAEVTGLTTVTSAAGSSYIGPVTTAPVTRDQDEVTTTYPTIGGTSLCVGATVRPVFSGDWSNPNDVIILAAGNEAAANSWRIRKGSATLLDDTFDATATVRLTTITHGINYQDCPLQHNSGWYLSSPAAQFGFSNGRLLGVETGSGVGTVGVGGSTLQFGFSSTATKGLLGYLRDVRLYANTSTCRGGELYPLLFDDGPSTISHVTFRNSKINDLRGRPWTASVEPTQAGSFPPSILPNDGSHYTIAPGIINPSGSPFTACFATASPSLTNGTILDMLSGSNGVRFRVSGSSPSYTASITTGTETVTANTTRSSQLQVWCAGHDGTNNLVKLGRGATVTAAATFTPDTTITPVLGRAIAAGSAWASSGRIFEVILTTDTPTDALFTTMINTAAARWEVYLPAP